jgi:hypothetical protein
MRVQLKKGQGTIANAIFELRPGIVADIPGSMVDLTIMDVLDEPVVVEPVKEDNDLNNDGKVDEKDVSLASRVLRTAKKTVVSYGKKKKR